MINKRKHIFENLQLFTVPFYAYLWAQRVDVSAKKGNDKSNKCLLETHNMITVSSSLLKKKKKRMESLA